MASYDLIIVGAGGDNGDKSFRADGDRWVTRLNPELGWDYKSTPQEWLSGRKLDLDRGKGLGGSTAINFSLYQVPPRGDFEEITRLLDDETWKWDEILQRHRRLENYHTPVDQAYGGYVKPTDGVHGSDGPLNIAFPDVLEKQGRHMLNVLEQSSLSKNLDLNDGNGIGFGLVPGAAYKGVRSTARDLLSPTPENVTILVNTTITKVLFQGSTTKAIGVLSAEGDKYFASKDIILSAGALDTPKLLILSGIGPREHLQDLGISVRVSSPRVGKGLKDHPFSTLVYERKPHTTDRPEYWRSEERRAAARKQWELDGTGDLSSIAVGVIMGLVKNDRIYQSSEFKDLPDHVRNHLMDPTVPLYEFNANTLSVADLLNPNESIPQETIPIFPYNTLSEGEVLLASSDPTQPPLVDCKMFSHPFDRRVAIEAVREFMNFAEEDVFARDTVRDLDVPKSKSDDDICEFWKSHTSSSWHGLGTAKMGKVDDPTAVVGTDFRVNDVQNLRIVDLSVAPLMVNAHTTSFAYLIGLTAADKLIEEYGYDV